MTDHTANTPAPEPKPVPAPEHHAAPEHGHMPAPAPVAPQPVAPIDPAHAPMSSGEMAATILGTIFLTPTIPLILWIVWNQTFPTKGKQAIKIFWIFVAIYVLLICCVVVASWGFIGALGSSMSNMPYYNNF